MVTKEEYEEAKRMLDQHPRLGEIIWEYEVRLVDDKIYRLENAVKELFPGSIVSLRGNLERNDLHGKMIQIQIKIAGRNVHA